MVAGLILCQLVISALAAAMAWSVACFASLLGWPRRGVWAVALLCSLALPVILVMYSPQQTRSTSAADTSSATPSDEVRTFAPRVVDPATPGPRSIAPRTRQDQAGDAPSRRQLAPTLRLPVFPKWDGVLAVLWIASSVAALCLLSVSVLHVRRLVRGLPQTHVHGVRVLVSDDLGPAVFGWLHPVIVVPGSMLGFEHRRLVLLHEQSHARVRDPLLFTAFLTAVALAPWNPVLWWQLRQLRFAIEVDCDRRVLRTGVDVASYGQMLLQMASLEHRQPLGAMALTEPVSQLRKRVTIMTADLSMRTRVRLAVVAFGVLGISAAVGTQLEPPERARETVEAGNATQNVLGNFNSTLTYTGLPSADDTAIRAAELEAALGDPNKRAALLAQRHLQIRSNYPGLVEFLGLDPVTAQQLIDLMADQSLETDLRQLRVPPVMGLVPSGGNAVLMEPVNTDQLSNAVAEELGRHRAALQRVLGEPRFGRYLDYVAQLPVRQEIARFSERSSQEQLSIDQRERMVALLMVERGIRLSDIAMTPQDMATYLRRARFERPYEWTITAEQNILRSIERRDRLVRNAASVLTASQLAMLEKIENEDIDAQRSNVQRLKASVLYKVPIGGAATPDRARTVEDRAAGRRMLSGRLRWSVTVVIGEGEPIVASFLSSFGERVSFDAGAGLSVEATPVAYDVEQFTVDLKIYESDVSGVRHLIDDSAAAADFGAAALTRGELAKRRVVMAGSKSYRVAISVAGSLE